MSSKTRLSQLFADATKSSVGLEDDTRPVEPVVDDTTAVPDTTAAPAVDDTAVPPVTDDVPVVTDEPAAPTSDEPVSTDEPAVPAIPEVPAAPAVDDVPAIPSEEPAAPATDEPVVPAVDPIDAPAATDDVPAAPLTDEPALPASDEPLAPIVDTPAAPASDDEPSPFTPISVPDTDTAEASLVAVRDSAAEVAEVDAAHSRFHEIAEGLEAIAQYAHTQLNEGGLTPQSAGMMSIAVENLIKPLGWSDPVVLSVESFGGHSTRVEATTLSFEGIQEVAKQVLDAIIAVGKKLWETVKSFIERVFATASKVEARADALIEKAKTATGSPKASEIDVGPAAEKLAIAGKVVGPLEGLTALTRVTDGFLAYDDANYAKLMDMMSKVQALLGAEDANFADAMKDVQNMEIGVGGMYSVKDESKNTYSTPILPGGKTFWVAVGPALAFLAGEHGSDQQVPEDAKLPTLSPADIAKVGEMAKQVATVAVIYHNEAKSMKEKQPFETVEGFRGMTEGKLNEENSKQAVDQLRILAKTSAETRKYSARILGYVISTVTSYLSLAEKSLAQYGAGEAAPAEEPAKEDDKPAEPAAAAA